MDEANKTKQHTRCLTLCLAVAHVKGGQWYPVKSDCIMKQYILEQEVNNGKTRNKGFAKDLKADHSFETADCSAIRLPTSVKSTRGKG